MNRLRGAGMLTAVAVAVGYALAAHYSNSHLQAGTLGAVLVLLPLLAMAWLWRHSWRPLWWLAAVAVVLIVVGWPVLEHNFSLLLLLQQCAVYAALAASFGMTLRAGQTPLCTRIAAQVHQPLPAMVARYTRRVTLVWTVLFAALTLALVVGYLMLPLQVWSLCANFGAPLSMALMFLVEALVRRRALPPQMRAGLLATLRAFLDGQARGPRDARS